MARSEDLRAPGGDLDSKLPHHAAAISALFTRVVAALERTLPFDRAMLVLVSGEDEVLVVKCSSGRSGSHGLTLEHKSSFSDRLWPSADESPVFVSDAAGSLDLNFTADQQLIQEGARAMAAVRLPEHPGSGGLFVLTRHRTDDFDPATSETLKLIGEFMAVAAEREHAWQLEQVRHRRRTRLEALVPAIGESLDVRNVFLTLSSVIQEVVPHDILAFALLTPDRGGVRMQASTHHGVMELPEYRYSNEEERLDSNWQYLVAYDLTPLDEQTLRVRTTPWNAPERGEAIVRPGPAWMKFITANNIHSTLRVPIRAKDRPLGGIVFMSSRLDAYDEEDGLLAARITDLVALSLAHQELAEEARRIAVADERARVLERHVEALQQELDSLSAHRALGASALWKKALADATQVAGTDTTVLITGESGTGKEVIARFIHRGSKRARGPFVALNCAALPEQLLESELFGHERGAFTGALVARAGRIEQAAGGVLFLDEVGEMSPAVQAKFLRVLQEREFQRVGGSRTIKAEVRLVAATNRDPRAGIAAGTFREDLYYRLGVFEIHLPPLRERPEDILVLAEAFLEEVGRGMGRPSAGLSHDAREQLLSHTWPGNVRELRNAIERAVITCQGGLITREHLPIAVARSSAQTSSGMALQSAVFPSEGVPLESVERRLLEQAMAKAGQNKSQAAKLLGVTRGQLYSLLRRHGLTDARR